MKKLFLLLPSLIFVLAVFSCKVNIDTHNHEYSKSWSSDAEYHWHVATCGHGSEVSDRQKHTFGNFVSNNDATETSNGTKSKQCTVCGYVGETIEDIGSMIHEHSYDSSFVCTCGKVKELTVKEFITALGYVTVITADSSKTGITISADGKTANVYGVSISGEFDKNTFPYTLVSVDLRGLNTTNVTSMKNMFLSCRNLKELDLSSLDTSNVIDMSNMFQECQNLTSLDLSNFDTSNVTNMSFMFYYCINLVNLKIKSFNTFNVTDMSIMFYYCTSLNSLDLSNFNTNNVTKLNHMFIYCEKLTSLDIRNFDTSKVINNTDMFCGCGNSTNPLSITYNPAKWSLDTTETAYGATALNWVAAE